MQQIVGWLERPQKKVGLDNLGTQQPCVMIYSRLLPGVTNVTDRAAYFGFYPWFIRAFEVRYPDATDAAFTDALRRADCLMTLVAERHALVCGGDIGPHSATCPGRRKLGPLCQRMDAGEVAELTRYADKRDNNPTRYFKNSLGGLGQYYLGPLRDEYHVLHGDARRGVKYWEDRAIPLADAYGQGLDSDLFFAVLEATSVTAADLDDLAAFCPCSLQSDVRPAARDELLAFFLEDNTPNGLARRATFALLLNFLDTQSGVETDDAVKDFLAACYAMLARRSLGSARQARINPPWMGIVRAE